jgi:hypothetical protein
MVTYAHSEEEMMRTLTTAVHKLLLAVLWFVASVRHERALNQGLVFDDVDDQGESVSTNVPDGCIRKGAERPYTHPLRGDRPTGPIRPTPPLAE